MISIKQAQQFAREWVDAWNSHDLDRILSHYADDFQMTSPFIVTMMNEPTGTIKGKEKVTGLLGQSPGAPPGFAFRPH